MGDQCKKHADICTYLSPKWCPLALERSLVPYNYMQASRACSAAVQLEV